MPRRGGADPHLAYVLRSLREAQGRSQEALAHDAGLTVAALARVERAQVNPSWLTVRSIASELGISLSDLGQAIEQREKR